MTLKIQVMIVTPQPQRRQTDSAHNSPIRSAAHLGRTFDGLTPSSSSGRCHEGVCRIPRMERTKMEIAALPPKASPPAGRVSDPRRRLHHTGGCTPGCPSDFGHWWRPRLLPSDASWLNQAELLLDAFELTPPSADEAAERRRRT